MSVAPGHASKLTGIRMRLFEESVFDCAILDNLCKITFSLLHGYDRVVVSHDRNVFSGWITVPPGDSLLFSIFRIRGSAQSQCFFVFVRVSILMRAGISGPSTRLLVRAVLFSKFAAWLRHGR